MNSEDLIIQARARIIWGEASSSVRAFLTSNGIPASEADSVIDEMMAERNRELRKQGVVKICAGSMLVIGALAFFLVSYGRVDLHRMSIKAGRAFIGTAALIALGGLYGFSKLMGGIIYVVRPQNENKSISEI